MSGSAAVIERPGEATTIGRRLAELQNRLRPIADEIRRGDLGRVGEGSELQDTIAGLERRREQLFTIAGQ